MSRIHEALKKAEQERGEQQGIPSVPAYAPEDNADSDGILGSDLGVSTYPGVPANGGIPLTAGMPPTQAPFTANNLASRCSQQVWQPDRKTMLFFSGDETAPGTEEFRTLRSRLYHVRETMPLKKLLITSALPKEGKSFTAANLAGVLARQHGRRVLLIDADLRRPRLHTMLGTTASPGLESYLNGSGDEIAIMQRGPLENLFFIPCGSMIPDPAELVSNGRMKLLLQKVESMFDWIIVDSPPTLPVSDASVLATACDGVLLVVRSNSTPIDMARKARQEFSQNALVGVVLNGSNSSTPPYTQYYYDAASSNGSTSRS